MEYTMNEPFEALCQLCSINTKIENLNVDAIDWQSSWELALRHKVVPVMADRIKQLAIPVPDEIAQLIEKHVQKNLFKGMSLAAELVQLTQLFQAHDVSFLAFKGIALSKIMKLELHQRHNGDLDLLLIEFDDFKRVDILLKEVGYKRITLPKTLNMNSRQAQHFSKHEKDIVYFHSQKKIKLELHIKLFLSDKALPIQLKDLYLNKAEILVGATTIPIMSKEDHQIYLLVHGAFSPWARLKWLCDIPLISDNGNDYLSNDFLKKTQFLGIERMVIQGLSLSHELLKMPISTHIEQSQKENKKIIKFAKDILLNKEYTLFNFKEKLLFWVRFSIWYLPSLRKDYSFKLDHYKSYLTRTSDWEVISLPSSLFWLYYPLRPFLWLKRQF